MKEILAQTQGTERLTLPSLIQVPMPTGLVEKGINIDTGISSETLGTFEKDESNLGDLNPLINRADLARKESTDVIIRAVRHRIESTGGILPKFLEVATIYEPISKNTAPRFLARFEVLSLDDKQLTLLENLVDQTYPSTVRTRTDDKGNKIPMEDYPPIQKGEEGKSHSRGWYMGPNLSPTNSFHQGLYLFKTLGEIHEDNFLDEKSESGSFVVEIRDAELYQTDLVTFVTQVASVLGQGKLLDKGQQLYEAYYDLIRRGLRKREAEAIYGMGDAMDMIQRELFTPLASPEISAGIGEDPQSVLMIGIPGTGKTLIAETLLKQETGTFILPIDALVLQEELRKPKDQQKLIQRIVEVGRISGKPVVLHVDDIEKIVQEGQDTNSTLLNIMAGVQESGFYIIASTNYPEKINPALIQPQRFSVLIHCGLQNEKARLEILKMHADVESKELKKPLFVSVEIRDMILNYIAGSTENFTPRYLGKIVNSAKSHLIARVAESKETTVGLTEADLEGFMFEVGDWEKAYNEINSQYDRKGAKTRDNELRRFIRKHAGELMGFARVSTDQGNGFSLDFLARVAAAEAKSKSLDRNTAKS